MSQAPITLGGIPISSDAPTFLTVLAIHVAAGLTAVVSGVVAMLSQKGPGRHPRAGTVCYWSLGVVFATMTFLAVTRWAHDYHLFILGALAFVAATAGRHFAPSRTAGRVRIHIVAIGSSYILLLTAFYVDNGAALPVWRNLPTLAYWLVPLLVGAPLIARALRHPIAFAEHRRRASTGAA